MPNTIMMKHLWWKMEIICSTPWVSLPRRIHIHVLYVFVEFLNLIFINNISWLFLFFQNENLSLLLFTTSAISCLPFFKDNYILGTYSGFILLYLHKHFVSHKVVCYDYKSLLTHFLFFLQLIIALFKNLFLFLLLI